MFLSRISLENFLSFKNLDLELRPLNVLVGPNATGKSNFIRSFELSQSLPNRAGISGLGSVSNARSPGVLRLHLKGALKGESDIPLDYSVTLKESGQALAIIQEEFKDVFVRDQDGFALGSPATMKGSA